MHVPFLKVKSKGIRMMLNHKETMCFYLMEMGWKKLDDNKNREVKSGAHDKSKRNRKKTHKLSQRPLQEKGPYLLIEHNLKDNDTTKKTKGPKYSSLFIVIFLLLCTSLILSALLLASLSIFSLCSSTTCYFTVLLSS